MIPQKRQPKSTSHRKNLFQDIPSLDIDKFIKKKNSIIEQNLEYKFLI
jgi:hypothetical protein